MKRTAATTTTTTTATVSIPKPRFGSRPVISSTSRPHDDHNNDDGAVTMTRPHRTHLSATPVCRGSQNVCAVLCCAVSPSIKPNDLCLRKWIMPSNINSSWTNLLIKQYNARATSSACQGTSYNFRLKRYMGELPVKGKLSLILKKNRLKIILVWYYYYNLTVKDWSGFKCFCFRLSFLFCWIKNIIDSLF